MRRLVSRFRRSEQGASAVEFALVLPVFLLMTFGIIEFGRLFWTSHALHETAISTARCMGIPQLECSQKGGYDAARTIRFAEDTARGWYITLQPASITVNRDATCRGLNDFSSVVIQQQFRTALPQLITSLAGGTNLSASACFPNH